MSGGRVGLPVTLGRSTGPGAAGTPQDRLTGRLRCLLVPGQGQVHGERRALPGARRRPRSRRRGPSRSSRRWSGRGPDPWMACSCAVVERKNRVNRSRCSASGMPRPLSLTSRRARPSSTSSVQRTQPPSSVNFTALLTRLVTMRSRLGRSPGTITGSGGTSNVTSSSRASMTGRSVDCGRRRPRRAGRRPCARGSSAPVSRLDERQQVVGQRRQPVAVATDRLDELRLLLRSAARPPRPGAARRSRRCWSSGSAARG